MIDSDFRHQVLAPEDLPLRVSRLSPIRFRHSLLKAWLLDNTGQTDETIFPNSCGDIPFWDNVQHDKYLGGKIAISVAQFDQLVEASSSRITPELQTELRVHEGVFVNRFGFDVWGMGQHFQPVFNTGEVSAEAGLLHTPPEVWIVENVYLR